MVFGGPEHGGAASEEPCYGTGAAGHMAVRPCARLAEVRTARGALRERRYEHEVRGTRVVSAGEQEQQGERGRSRSGNVVILHASMNALLIRNQRRRENIPKNLDRMSKVVTSPLSPSFLPLHSSPGPSVTHQSSSRQVRDETDETERRQVQTFPLALPQARPGT